MMKETAVINKTQRYKSYKDSGVEWLGKIPEHWEATRVKNIFRLVVEPAPNNNDFELLSVYTDIGVKPRRELKERGNKASTTDGYWLVKKGDVIVNKLLAWMGAIGVSNYDGVTSPAYDILRAKVKIESNFYHYLFRNSACISELKKHSRGIMDMRLRLYFDKFGDVVIPYPNYEEQKIIVDYLDDKTTKIDEAIAIKEQQINLLKERKQILIHKAVTRGLDENVTLKDSDVEWIGEIPEHWEVKRLKYVAELNYGISPNEKTYNDIGEGTVLVNGPVEYSKTDFGYTRSLKWTTEPVKFAKKGDLLFCLRGSTTGRLNICHQDLSIGRGCASLRAKENHQFLIKAIIALKDQIIETFKGSTFPSITSFELNNYFIPIPPLSEQKEISEYVETASKKIETAINLKHQEIEKLKEYKSSLINGVVTGKVRVC